MISTKKTETVPIVLDGEEVEVPAGINLVDAAALFKKEIPHYCYHPQLSVAGNCRMCLIEMGTPMRDRGTGEAILNEDGSPKIGWVPKPVIGCATTVSPGMHVKTISEKVTDCREGLWNSYWLTTLWIVRFAIRRVNVDYKNSPLIMVVATVIC